MRANHVPLLLSRSFIIIAVVLSPDLQVASLREKTKNQKDIQQSTPVSSAFKYLNSSESQGKYPKRLKVFFDQLGLTGAACAGDNESII